MKSGAVWCSVVLAFFFSVVFSADSVFDLGGEDLAPLANGLLMFDPTATSLEIGGTPNAETSKRKKFPLVLAEERTRRPDVLRKFRWYIDGWDITNKHYWASVAYTGMVAFVLAVLWFIFFGLALLYRGPSASIFSSVQLLQFHRIRLILLVVFSCGAGTGCILLSVGQHGFRSEVTSGMRFVVKQTEFTVEILRNVTEFLSVAKTINLDQIILPSQIQNKIDGLNVELKNAADTLSDTTSENSVRTKHVLDQIRSILLSLAVLTFCLTTAGFDLFSLAGFL